MLGIDYFGNFLFDLKKSNQLEGYLIGNIIVLDHNLYMLMMPGFHTSNDDLIIGYIHDN